MELRDFIKLIEVFKKAGLRTLREVHDYMRENGCAWTIKSTNKIKKEVENGRFSKKNSCVSSEI